jgi:hypothetical protein
MYNDSSIEKQEIFSCANRTFGKRWMAPSQMRLERGNMETNYNLVRKEITERLARSWNFSEQQLADLSVFHLVNLLMLLAGQFGYLGQFCPTVFALREVLGEDELYDKPSELRAKQSVDGAANIPVVN